MRYKICSLQYAASKDTTGDFRYPLDGPIFKILDAYKLSVNPGNIESNAELKQRYRGGCERAKVTR